MLPTVTAKELKDAMPQFREEAVQKQVREEIPKLPFALRVRCGLVDYILNGEEGTLEDRVYSLVAEMLIDIEEDEEKKSA